MLQTPSEMDISELNGIQRQLEEVWHAPLRFTILGYQITTFEAQDIAAIRKLLSVHNRRD